MTVRVYCVRLGRKSTVDMSVNCLNPMTRSAHATRDAYQWAWRRLGCAPGDVLKIIKTPAIGSVTAWDGKTPYATL